MTGVNSSAMSLPLFKIFFAEHCFVYWVFSMQMIFATSLAKCEAV